MHLLHFKLNLFLFFLTLVTDHCHIAIQMANFSKYSFVVTLKNVLYAVKDVFSWVVTHRLCERSSVAQGDRLTHRSST